MPTNFIIFFTFILFIHLAYLNHLSLANSKSYVLSCGAPSEGVDSDGRKWEPDSKIFDSTSNTATFTVTAGLQDPSLPSTIPYMTARVSKSQFSYNLPLSNAARHFLRLHFYPSNYPSINASIAFFSVFADSISLLQNFSAFITAEALTQAYIVREFSLVNTQSRNLNLTFTPSSNYKDSCAFINGIEVIPSSNIYKEATMVGFNDQSFDVSSSTLQTMFRLNVGGQFIPGVNDSALLLRTWYDDSPYLYGAGVGVTTQANMTIQYPTKDTPKEIAPLDVYKTARTMGPSSIVNINYNLTWVFRVDPNFTYFVRLHFCEFIMMKINQRAFNVYLDNRTAVDGADVIAWAGEAGVPMYKDYAVYVSKQVGVDDDELWVAMHPYKQSKPEYYDAILSGLEILKVNDTKGNLAGPNPLPSPMMVSLKKATHGFSSSSPSHTAMVGGVAGGLVGLSAAVGFGLFVMRKKKGNFRTRSGSISWLPLHGHSHTASTISGHSTISTALSTLAQGLCRHFSLQEITQATKNFDESRVIGVGGFGKVYRGVIDQDMKVAIKRSNPQSEQGVHEFRTEIEMLSKLRHKHLVSLIGFCEEDGEMALVYDYMANGTLREHIYKGGKNTPLPWKQRLEICIGAARGLHYLHTGARYTIIHRDVKTTNILLDENWVAKVSDFGLSKTGPNMNQTHVSTVVKGSFGYLDPEYFRRQQLTEKSDVYSFGVVLFEVLCARPALNPNLPKEQVSLADWALHCHKKGSIGEIVDNNIKSEIGLECLRKFIETAIKCLADHGFNRPSMGDILWNLEFSLQLQENPEGAKAVAQSKGFEQRELLRVDEECVVGAIEIEDGNADDIFSQIVNPRGR